ncbi:MAG: aconitate hydratase, partial [Elusimicrobia bacterium]|nr:aconitate hydratase [Elusimicrobiota bacterium]
MEENLSVVRNRLKRPLTYAEKVLYGHIADPKNQELNPGKGTLRLYPDRIAMQDATAQMALLQFSQARIKRVAVPTTVHCDHLIRAYVGAQKDMETALKENKEVYDFLRSASNKYGIGFWQPGAGIIHQVVLENYAFPGGMMIGTDSHTPNAGGLGMVASGVGGADAVDVMAGLPWEVKHPTVIGVHLVGELNGWASPKDIILYLCGVLTTKGGTNKIIEYFGPGVETISCTGKATITNMGAELGATTSLFPYDRRMAAYLSATRRSEIADIAEKYKSLLSADPEVFAHPENYYEQVIKINLNQLEPYIVGPHSPDLARPISQFAREVQEKNYPDKISAALIGSCTNSSYEDLSRAADVALQAKSAKLKMPVSFLVSPGSDQIFETVKRDGQAQALEEIGGNVLANACGPCIGQWKRDDIQPGERNSILSSFNRNFPKRNDGNAETFSFIGSPEIVVALGLAGRLSFNPLKDTLESSGGTKLKLNAPKKAEDIPKQGFVSRSEGYISPAEDGEQVRIEVDPKSERLQLLDPFPAWDGRDFLELPILLKAKGKCTTDHISPAGPWLRYRGHLDKISDNLFLGAVNAYSGETGKTANILTGEKNVPIPKVAREYKTKNLKWVVVGDDNYGEGSSR